MKSPAYEAAPKKSGLAGFYPALFPSNRSRTFRACSRIGLPSSTNTASAAKLRVAARVFVRLHSIPEYVRSSNAVLSP